MRVKRIALAGYPARYFLPFGRSLEAAGFEVHWIAGLRSEAARLVRNGVPARQVLDTSRAADTVSGNECVDILSTLERTAGPRVRDVILMDRMLRRRPNDFACRYIAGVAKLVAEHLEAHDIRLVTSGRDTAMHLTTMLVCHRDGRLWVVPTRARLPPDRFGFMASHECASWLPLRDVREEDRCAARLFLDEFRARRVVPQALSSARGLGDVIRRLPMHARLMSWALTDAFYDAGNRHSRYTVLDLGRLWLRRRRNMLGIAVTRPYREVDTRPYVLYALHTQPESSIDVIGSFHSDQVTIVNQIARATPSTHDLYVKAHPSDIDGKPPSFFRALAAVPGVTLIDPLVDSRELLARASAVVTVTGTIGYEAGLLGIPAVTFAPLFFNALPSVTYCEAPTRLPEILSKLLEPSPPVNYEQGTVDFLARLHSLSVPGDFCRIDGALTEDDLTSLQAAYDRLNEAYVEQAGTARAVVGSA